jgi:hypothetical protein
LNCHPTSRYIYIYLYMFIYMYKFIFAYKCINIYLYYAKQKPIIKLRWKKLVFLNGVQLLLPSEFELLPLSFADYIPKIKKIKRTTTFYRNKIKSSRRFLILLKKCIRLNRNWFEMIKLNLRVYDLHLWFHVKLLYLVLWRYATGANYYLRFEMHLWLKLWVPS